MKKYLITVIIPVLFSGCASVAVTGDALESRTSSALGMEPSEFTISNRTDDGVRTDYKVTTKKGAVYSCYVTGTISYFGRAVSDAICNARGGAAASNAGSTGSAAKGSCNALTHAAGKC